MRHYHPYTQDQAYLLPVAPTEVILPTDPVHVVRRAVDELDLGAMHRRLRAEQGRPPFEYCKGAPVA
jgi:hypothetical protein